MGKSPSIKDYGGDHFTSGRRGRVKLGKDTTISMRCVDCQALRYVLPDEARRAARPHCLKCGGPLTPAASQVDRTKALRRPMDRLGDTHPVRCKACGDRSMDARGLADHLTKRTDCVRYYRDEEDVQVIGAGCRILPGTAYVEKVGKSYKAWHVFALALNGTRQEVGRYDTRHAATESLPPTA